MSLFFCCSYNESCEINTCNQNQTIAALCSTAVAAPMNSMTHDLSLSSSSGLPPPIGSTTYNYMTIEELKEFMLNEQKV